MDGPRPRVARGPMQMCKRMRSLRSSFRGKRGEEFDLTRVSCANDGGCVAYKVGSSQHWRHVSVSKISARICRLVELRPGRILRSTVVS